MRISSAQPRSVMRGDASQKRSGDASSPAPSSSVMASYWTPVALASRSTTECPSLTRIEDHTAVVRVVAIDVIVVGVRRADDSRVGIVELERRIERAVVESEPGRCCGRQVPCCHRGSFRTRW